MRTDVPDQTAEFEFDGFGQKATVEELESGDLLIRGVAANLSVDDQDEAFEQGALEDGVKGLVGAPLLYHHRSGHALGQVLEAELEHAGEQINLNVAARVDKPAAGSWAEDVVNKIRKGTIRGLSVAGKFRRHLTPAGWRIYGARLRELSATPYAISPETSIVSVAAKAFEEQEEEIEDELTFGPDDAKAWDEIESALDEVAEDVTKLKTHYAV